MDDFWDTVPLGSVLHYHDGFNRFIRGIVVERKGRNASGDRPLRGLRSVAMVGAWTAYDLPRRGPDGEIKYPYHAAKILSPTPDSIFNPSPSCIYESDECTRSLADPCEMPPIDLSVPDITPEEEVSAAKYRLIQRLSDICKNDIDDYDFILAKMVETLKENGYA